MWLTFCRRYGCILPTNENPVAGIIGISNNVGPPYIAVKDRDLMKYLSTHFKHHKQTNQFTTPTTNVSRTQTTHSRRSIWMLGGTEMPRGARYSVLSLASTI